MDIGQQGRILLHLARSGNKERRADVSGAEISAGFLRQTKAGGTGKYCAVKDERGNEANIAACEQYLIRLRITAGALPP